MADHPPLGQGAERPTRTVALPNEPPTAREEAAPQSASRPWHRDFAGACRAPWHAVPAERCCAVPRCTVGSSSIAVSPSRQRHRRTDSYGLLAARRLRADRQMVRVPHSSHVNLQAARNSHTRTPQCFPIGGSLSSTPPQVAAPLHALLPRARYTSLSLVTLLGVQYVARARPDESAPLLLCALTCESERAYLRAESTVSGSSIHVSRQST